MTAAAHTGTGAEADPAPALVDAAIAWFVRLESGLASDTEQAALARWRRADPAHERAWQLVSGVDAPFLPLDALPAHLAWETMEAAHRLQAQARPRRRALKALCLGALGIALGAATMRQLPLAQRERHTTATGEQRRLLLADGTSLHLNTGSEAEVVFSPLRRLIVLHRGEIRIDTGPDDGPLTGRRPFHVHARNVRLEALGTRFTVRQDEASVRLHVAAGSVAVRAPAPGGLISPGMTVSIDPAAPHPVQAASPVLDPEAWAQGALVVRRMRLDAFIAELARYRLAPLACDPAVAHLQVSGVFQLSGGDPVPAALDALARSLPIRVAADSGNGARILPR